MTPQTFVFIGRSGCGKGTQVELLQKHLAEHDPGTPIFYVETGERFRNFIGTEGYTNSLANNIQKVGGLQPAFLAVWMWSNILIEELTPTQHLIIDGTPRKLGEAIIFTEAMKFYSRTATVVHINVSREWSEKRLAERNRSDDELAVIKKRLDWFDTDVVPAIDYFRTKAHSAGDVNFLDINGEQTIEEVHADILKQINLN